MDGPKRPKGDDPNMNITLTKAELARVISALDFTLIEIEDTQFTDDQVLLDSIYVAAEGGLSGDDVMEATRTLAERLAQEFTKEAA